MSLLWSVTFTNWFMDSDPSKSKTGEGRLLLLTITLLAKVVLCCPLLEIWRITFQIKSPQDFPFSFCCCLSRPLLGVFVTTYIFTKWQLHPCKSSIINSQLNFIWPGNEKMDVCTVHFNILMQNVSLCCQTPDSDGLLSFINTCPQRV